MIRAPYRGPVVTSMNAFLSRNSLSRPVRQSLRQQFRETTSFNPTEERPPQMKVQFSNPKFSNQPNPSFPSRQRQSGQFLHNREQANQFEIQHQQLNNRQPTSFLSSSQNVIGEDRQTRQKFTPSQQIPFARGFSEFSPVIFSSDNINRETSEPIQLYFDNGVGAGNFKHHRGRRSAEHMEPSVVHNVKTPIYHNQLDYVQTYADSVSKTFENMLQSIQNSLPSSLYNLPSYLGLSPTSQYQNSAINEINNQVTYNNAPILAPYIVPVKPAALVIPSPPHKNVGKFKREYVRKALQGITNEGEFEEGRGSIRRTRKKRSAQHIPNQRPHRIKKRNHPPVRQRAQPIPVRAQRLQSRPFTNGGNERPSKQRNPHAQRGRFGPNQNKRIKPSNGRVGQRNNIKLRPGFQLMQQGHPGQNFLLSQPVVNTVKTNEHEHLKTSSDVHHTPKGNPPPENHPPAINVDHAFDDPNHEHIVQTNFADLPVINEVSNNGRMKEIEALIHRHNNEINKFRPNPQIRTDVNPSFGFPPTRRPPEGVHNFFDDRSPHQQDVGMHSTHYKFNQVSKIPDHISNGGTVKRDTVNPFKSEITSFPNVDFMSNFRTPFENGFFGINEETKQNINDKPKNNFKSGDFHVRENGRYQEHTNNNFVREPVDPNLPVRVFSSMAPSHFDHPSSNELQWNNRPIGGPVTGHPVIAYVPGPAPLASVLPRYNTVKAPVNIFRENFRTARNTRQEDVPISRKRRTLPDELRDFRVQFVKPFGKQIKIYKCSIAGVFKLFLLKAAYIN